MTCLVSDTLLGRGQNRTLAVFPGNEGTVVLSLTGFQTAVRPSGGGWLAQSFSSTFGSGHDVVVRCEGVARSLGSMSQLSTTSPRVDLILHLLSDLPPSSLQPGSVLTDGSYVIL